MKFDNYQFCADWVIRQAPPAGARVLDYGCGAGQIVALLRENNLESFGCDVFYEGGDYSTQIEGDLLGSVIRRMQPGGAIPFDDSSFDFIVNNQVMEHVQDLDLVLAEIERVLKPGGQVLSLFPDKSVWREGHCGVPFLHLFPKGTRPRIYYAAAFRLLGFGHFKGDKGVKQWSEDFCGWLDQWTYYRTTDEINASYSKVLGVPRGIESDWLAARLGKRARLTAVLPRVVQEFVVHKLAGRIFVCSKASA
jgi:SAM-dependent methyltransferase